MTVRRTLLALLGLLLLGSATPVATWLSSGGSWWGLVAFWGVLGIPGLMALAVASSRGSPRVLLPALPATLSLIGLDVIDSARREVVFAGYVWFAVLLTAAAVLCASPLRRRGSRATMV